MKVVHLATLTLLLLPPLAFGQRKQDDPDKVVQDLMRLSPRDIWFDFTSVLIDHGRQTCQAKKPRCADCPVNDLCPSSLV